MDMIENEWNNAEEHKVNNVNEITLSVGYLSC